MVIRTRFCCLLQQVKRRANSRRGLHIGGIADNPHKSLLRDRACGPAPILIASEPLRHARMKHMIFPQESEQSVHVQQGDTHGSSLSIASFSANAFSSVIISEAGPGEKIRMPFSHFVGTSALRPRSRISEAAAPLLIDLAAAYSFTCSRRSSLMSRVVLIAILPCNWPCNWLIL